MDNGYGMFRELLEYKLKWEGKKIVRVDRLFFHPVKSAVNVAG